LTVMSTEATLDVTPVPPIVVRIFAPISFSSPKRAQPCH
jgi:hypothetical protein